MPVAPWKRLWVVFLIPFIFMGAAVGFNLIQTPMYEASILVRPEPDWGTKWDTSLGPQLIPPALRLSDEVILELQRAIEKPAIAEETIRRLGLRMTPDELLKGLSTAQDESTPSIKLSYKDANPQRAQKVVNTVAQVASEQIRKETPYDYDLRILVWGHAKLPSTPVSPNPGGDAAVALLFGIIVSTCATALFAAKDGRLLYSLWERDTPL